MTCCAVSGGGTGSASGASCVHCANAPVSSLSDADSRAGATAEEVRARVASRCQVRTRPTTGGGRAGAAGRAHRWRQVAEQRLGGHRAPPGTQLLPPPPGRAPLGASLPRLRRSWQSSKELLQARAQRQPATTRGAACRWDVSRLAMLTLSPSRDERRTLPEPRPPSRPLSRPPRARAARRAACLASDGGGVRDEASHVRAQPGEGCVAVACGRRRQLADYRRATTSTAAA